ncbi:hypothetical protein BU25DRAFT_457959 [Macroventuria anomochaeta]|uniref:Uncharacterized protein n=1 Tax=Macroventuria anomochaeta TaxID=301207 RepID=A0ACB6S2A3_9PLEO|nr:uncharacterized protein BU25DRAFT_457959 [Macroventuria anomochaeta]KAF2628097.1 hypothetical protein BU25DRAFT_457959 [Macroventuria anomochaeta]
MCLGFIKAIPFYWPSTYYNQNAFFYVDFGDQHSQGPNQPGRIRVTEGNIDLTGFESYAECITSGSWSNEKALSITIREWFPYTDGYQEVVHQGPTLILVTPEQTATATPSATAESANPELTADKIAGISFGAIIGAILLDLLYFSCCMSCYLSYYGFQEKSEIKRVKRQEARRIQEERAYVQPDVDTIKASVARGEIWTGPVRPGGMWAARCDWPAAPRRASRDDDEIRVVEERRMEEQRVKEQRIEQRRQEVARAEEIEPPAYEAPPPKYMP